MKFATLVALVGYTTAIRLQFPEKREPGCPGNATSASELTTELLNQRRYSLWCENHRMFDLRRYGLSNTLPSDRSGDQIFNVLPVPLTENEN